MHGSRIHYLTGVGLSTLVLAVCVTASLAQAPGSAALLTSETALAPDGLFLGPATLWLDGIQYSGTESVECIGEAGDYAWFGTETHVYDFGQLGTFELTGIGKTTFDVVQPDYRWHEYTGAGIITAGTGAFASSQGMFDLGGYTRWLIDPSGPPVGTAWASGPGRVYGLALIPQPSGIALMSVAALTLLGYGCRRRRN